MRHGVLPPKAWAPDLFIAKATPVIVGWFAGRVSKNKSAWNASVPTLLCRFWRIYTIYTYGQGPLIATSRVGFTWPRAYHKDAKVYFIIQFNLFPHLASITLKFKKILYVPFIIVFFTLINNQKTSLHRFL
jgi:hypothetical protein